MTELFMEFGREARKITGRAGGREVVGRNRFGDSTIRADLEIERLVSKRLSRLDCSFIGEETRGWWRDDAEMVFVVDPLDGSENYLHGFPSYSFAICGGRLKTGRFRDIEEAYILNLANGDEYHAKVGGGVSLNWKRVERRGGSRLLIGADVGSFDGAGEVMSFLAKKGYVRMLGASTLEMSLAACGSLDAFLHLGKSMRAVHSAGCFMMKEAGMRMVDGSGKKLDFGLRENGFEIIAAWDRAFGMEILSLLRSVKESAH